MGFDPIMMALSNDYTDSQRLARITKEQTIILPESEVVCNGGISGFNCEPLMSGEQYTVYIDGQKFETKAKEITIREDQNDEGTTVTYLGNSQPLDGVDSGENFGMIYFPKYGGAEFYYLPEVESEDIATHIVKITGTAEVIHPIDPKFLSPSRYLLNLSSVTLAETSNEVCIVEFVTLALTNGGTFSTTVSAENCEEFYTKAQKWAELSQEGYYVGELSDHAPQLIITDNLGMQLVPTAIYQLAEYLQQLFVSATLRLKQGDTFTIVTANCTVIFNANRSCDFFVTATAV